MKKTILAALSIFTLATIAASQDVIRNSAKPSNPKAGRVLSLKEEMRIEDTGRGFFFKNPSAIRVSAQGDILVKDGQDQVLQFDSQGRFLRNLFKNGQGPGELSSVYSIGVSTDRAYLLGYPLKILAFDAQGTLVLETDLRETAKYGPTSMILADREHYLLRSLGPPERPAGSGLADFPNYLFKVSPGGAVTKAGVFPIQGYYEVLANGGTSWSFFNSVQIAPISDNFLAVNSSPEYLVGVFDIDKETILRRFARPYRRVKRSSEGGVSGGGNAPPPPEFDQDIRALHAVDGKIWVQTSTVDEQKGILFDVYDVEGRYLDYFYIPTVGKSSKNKPINMTLTITGGCAYFRDKTEDDLIIIKKCRLVGL